MNEKRLFERFELSVPVRIEIPDEKQAREKMTLEADNLSAGGLFFKPGKDLPPGCRVRMEIILHFDELKNMEDPEGAMVIAVSGQVQRSGPEGTAISFLDDYEIDTSLEFLEKQKASQKTG